MIDSKEASAALADIDDIVQRVKQSQLYELASLAAVWWGVLVFAGNLVTWLWPVYAVHAWVAVDVLGVGGLVGIRLLNPSPRPHGAAFDVRLVLVFVLFFAFGYLCTNVVGHFGPRQLGAFWPLYFMLVPIEIMGMFVRAFALTMRLAANMTGGHIALMAILSLVFIFTEMFSRAVAGIGVGMVLSLPLAVIAVFIGMAIHAHH